MDTKENEYFDVIKLNQGVEFYLGGKYSKLSFITAPIDGFSTSSRSGVYVMVYADDKLIYTSPLITYRTSAIEVNLDISNAEYVTIYNEYLAGGYEEERVLIANATVAK